MAEPADLPLQCPRDHGRLSRVGSAYQCDTCGSIYPVTDNVVRFVESTDDFYEGAYMNQIRFVPPSESWLSALPLWLINSGYAWHVRRQVARGSVVLELGCAGGVLYFARRYRMIGLDISLAGLRSVSRIYDTCLQADAALGVPLTDASVDAVASSYFWEHLPTNTKTIVLSECRRILRPGGKLIFLYDVQNSNPLIRRLRSKDETLYQTHFLHKDGHLGYHTLSENERTFQKAGFRVLYHVAMERTPLQSLSVYSKMRHWPSGAIRLASRLDALSRSRWTLAPYTALLKIVDTSVGRTLPREWARIVLTVCERAPSPSQSEARLPSSGAVPW